jgi:hypothetical protein
MAPDVFLYRSVDFGESWAAMNPPPVAGTFPEDGSPAFSVLPNAVCLYGGYGVDGWYLGAPFTAPEEMHLPTSAQDTMIGLLPALYTSGDTLWCMDYYWINRSGAPTGCRMAYSTNHGQSWQFEPSIPAKLNVYNACARHTQQGIRLLTTGSDPSGTNYLYASDDRFNSWTPVVALTGAGSEVSQILQSTSSLGLTMLDYYGKIRQFWIIHENDTSPTIVTSPSSDPGLTSPLLIDRCLFAIGFNHGFGWFYNGTEWFERNHAPFWVQDNWSVYYGIAAVPGPASTQLVGWNRYADSLWVSADTGRSWLALPLATPYVGQAEQFSSLMYDSTRHWLWLCTSLGPCYADISGGLSATEPIAFQPAETQLVSAYPNPFNPVTNIRYDLERQSRVTLTVFDLQGRLVQTLADGVQPAGRHQVTFNGSALASGTYFVRFHTPTATRTEKLLLLK